MVKIRAKWQQPGLRKGVATTAFIHMNKSTQWHTRMERELITNTGLRAVISTQVAIFIKTANRPYIGTDPANNSFKTAFEWCDKYKKITSFLAHTFQTHQVQDPIYLAGSTDPESWVMGSIQGIV